MEKAKDDSARKASSKTDGQKPVHTVRIGAVAANIWLKQSPNGYYYYDFSLCRSWKSMSTNRTGYSTSFFERHRDDLVQVVMEASRWISDKLAAATTTTVDTTKDVA